MTGPLLAWYPTGGELIRRAGATVPPPPPPPDGGTGVQPTGPGIKRYQDIGPDISGDTGTISFAPGTVSLGPDFNYPSNFPVYGELAMQASLLVGSGMDYTFLQVDPNTMSAGPAARVPTQDAGGVNLLWVLRADKANVTDLSIYATPQQKQYNGLHLYKTPDGHTVARVRVKGIMGDSGAPPGETFSMSAFHTVNMLIDSCIIDGWGFGAQASTRMTATGLGLDFTTGTTIVRDTAIFGIKYFPIATYQCTDTVLMERLDLRGNTRGLNFEDNHGMTCTITDCDFRGSSTTGWHCRVDSSVAPSSVINVVDPLYDPIGGKFIFRNSPTYNYSGGSTPGAQKRTDLHLFIGGVERPDLVGFVTN